MPFITTSQGRRDGEFDGEDGVYVVTLVNISDPKTVTAQRGPKAGQEIDLLDWTFQLDNNQLIDASTSTASGPKSKMFTFLTALLGGKAPAIGQSFEKSDLIGRSALATIRRDDGGWPRIDNLGAIPSAMLSQRVASVTGAPLAAQPVAQAVGADLPF